MSYRGRITHPTAEELQFDGAIIRRRLRNNYNAVIVMGLDCDAATGHLWGYLIPKFSVLRSRP